MLCTFPNTKSKTHFQKIFSLHLSTTWLEVDLLSQWTTWPLSLYHKENNRKITDHCTYITVTRLKEDNRSLYVHHCHKIKGIKIGISLPIKYMRYTNTNNFVDCTLALTIAWHKPYCFGEQLLCSHQAHSWHSQICIFKRSHFQIKTSFSLLVQQTEK